MKLNLLRISTIAVAAALFVPAAADAQDKTGWPSSIKVGTASQGGTYFVYGAGWANLVQEMLGVNTSSEVTGGPVQNMALVQSGDVQFAMATMGPGYDGWVGKSPIAPGVEMKNVRATFPMYMTPFQIVALEKSGIKGIKDLDGKTVGVGPRGGTPGTYFPLWFKELGVNVKPQFGGANDLSGQVQDGLIDGFAFGAGLPIAAFAQIEAQVPVSLFAFTKDEQKKILEAFPSVSAFTIPANTYKSQTEEQHTVAMWNFGIANKDMPESLVYEVMKVVLDNNDRMMQIHKSAKDTLPKNYVNNSFMWFHPGAIRYYKEKNLPVDKKLLPPEYKG